jgi:hypothetical protein
LLTELKNSVSNVTFPHCSTEKKLPAKNYAIVHPAAHGEICGISTIIHPAAQEKKTCAAGWTIQHRKKNTLALQHSAAQLLAPLLPLLMALRAPQVGSGPWGDTDVMYTRR